MAPFCSIDQAFAYPFSDNILEFILLANTNPYKPEASPNGVYFNDYINRTVIIRGANPEDCGNPYNYTSFEGFIMNFSDYRVVLEASHVMHLVNVSVSGSNWQLEAINSNISYDVAILNAGILSQIFPLSFQSPQSLNLTMMNTTFNMTNNSALDVHRIAGDSLISIAFCSFFQSDSIADYLIVITNSPLLRFSMIESQFLASTSNLRIISISIASIVNCSFVYELNKSSIDSELETKTGTIDMGNIPLLMLENCHFEGFHDSNSRIFASNITTITYKNLSFKDIQSPIPTLEFTSIRNLTLTEISFENVTNGSLISVDDSPNCYMSSLTLKSQYGDRATLVFVDLGYSAICHFSNIIIDSIFAGSSALFAMQNSIPADFFSVGINNSILACLVNFYDSSSQSLSLIVFDIRNSKFVRAMISSSGDYQFSQANIQLTNGTMKKLNFPVFSQETISFSNISFNNVSIESCSFNRFLNLEANNSLIMEKVSFISPFIEDMGYFSNDVVFYANSKNEISISSFLFKNCSGYANTQRKIIKLGEKNLFTIKFSIIINPGDLISVLESNYLNKFQLVSSYFTGFKSKEAGGIFCVNQFSDLQIYDCEFANATSEDSGAVLLLQYLNTANITNTRFIQINSNYQGGILMAENINTIRMTNILAVDCVGMLGGVAMLAFENQMLLRNGILAFNYARNHGGALFMIEMNGVRAENLTVINSTSKENGGVFYLSLNNVIFFRNLTVKNSSAGLSGGFLMSISENFIDFSTVTFNNITSLLEGGGIYLSGGNNLTIRNMTMETMVSKQIMAAIYINCFNNVTVQDSVLFNSHGFKVKFGSILLLLQVQIKNANLENLPENVQFVEIICDEANIIFKHTKVWRVNAQFITASHCRIDNLTNVTIVDSFLPATLAFFFLQNTVLKGKSLVYGDNSMIFIEAKASTLILSGLKVETGGFLALSATDSKIILKKSSFRHVHSTGLIQTYQIELLPFDIMKKKAGFLFVSNCVLHIEQSEFIGGFASEGAAIVAIEYSKVDLISTNCALNTATDSGGCVSYEKIESGQNNCDFSSNPASLSLIRSIFLRNQALFGGSLYAAKTTILSCPKFNRKKVSLINRSRFLMGKAHHGGAIYYSKFSNNRIVSSKFLRNFAKDTNGNLSKAGAIFFGCPNSSCLLTNLTLLRTDFISNRASIGGAMFTENEPKNLSYSGVYQDNFAEYSGKDIATFPETISFLINFDKEIVSALSFKGLVSGAEYPKLFCLTGLDFFKQRAFENNMISNNLTIISDQGVKAPLLLLDSVGNDRICAMGTVVDNPKPDQKYHYTLVYRHKDFLNQSVLDLKIEFRPCDLGERQTDDFRCEKCPENYYSFARNSSDKCKSCQDETDRFRCYGGALISPMPGYWRLDNMSNYFIRCPNPASCLGYMPSIVSEFDITKSTGECYKGYKGVLCAECEDGYGITNGNYCTECASLLYYFYLIGFLVLRVLLLIYSLHRAVTMCASAAAGFLKTEEVLSSTIIKILLNHIQVLNIIISFPFEWNRSLFSTVMIVTGVNPNVSESYSWTCLFQAMGIHINTHYLKIINLWLSLLFLLAICYGYYRNYLTRKIKFYLKFIKKTDEDILESTYVIILFICYADFVTVALETFGCRDVGYEDRSEFRMVKDYSIRCWDETHSGWSQGLAIPYLFLFGLGFPMMILANLVYLYRKKQLNNKDSMIRLGFFYLSYENRYYYWDFVVLARKLILSLLNTFVVAVYQTIFSISVMFMFLILLVFLYIQVHCNPYLRKKLHMVNTLEKVSLISLSGTMFLAILSQQAAVKYTLKSVLLVLSLCFNLVFMGYWLSIYYQSDVRKTLRRVFHILIMIIQFLLNKLKACFERRPINSVRFERRVGLTAIAGGGFLRKSDHKKYINFEKDKYVEDVEARDGIRKRPPFDLDLLSLDFEYFSLETYTKQRKKNNSHTTNKSTTF